MRECDLDTSVPDWVIEHPESLALFKDLRIDYCCGGKSLAYACQERGLDAIPLLAAGWRTTLARRAEQNINPDTAKRLIGPNGSL